MISLRALTAPMISILLGGCAEAVPTAGAASVAVDCATPAAAAKKVQEGDRLVGTDPDKAAAAYAEAAQIDPRNHGSLFKLGMIHRKKEQWEDAVKALTKAGETAPGFASYWLELGRVRVTLAQRKVAPWFDAKAPLEQCVAVDPNLADCHVELGTVLLHLGDERSALASYTKGVERDPTKVAHYTMLAGLYVDLLRYDDAAAVLAAARPHLGNARPDQARYDVHVLSAMVHQQRGNLEQTARELEAAREAVPPDSPDSVLILWNLGSTYASLKTPRKAEATEMLKAFEARACRGAKAAKYKNECEQAQALMSRLGAP